MEVFVPAGALMSRNTSGHICQKNNNSGVNFIPFRENLKDYKIIGQGSVAIVGISNEIGNNFAIKMITKSSLNQKNMQYFLNELLIMKQINHPSIVCMKYVFQTETTYNLVLESFTRDKNEILFVSSNGWDVASAAGFGFKSVWVNRNSEPIDRLPWKPKHVLTNLTDIPKLTKTI